MSHPAAPVPLGPASTGAESAVIWVAPAIRATVALVLGVVITLTPDHGPLFGLLAFGAFALLTGAVLTAAGVRAPRSRIRALSLATGLVTLVAGVAATLLPTGGVAFFGLLVGVWAIVAGALELASGVLDRADGAARDRRMVGSATVLLGVVLLVVPYDLAQPFAGENGIAGTLTSSVVLVGALGAWAVIAGVVLAISAVSLRGRPLPAARS